MAAKCVFHLESGSVRQSITREALLITYFCLMLEKSFPLVATVTTQAGQQSGNFILRKHWQHQRL